MRVQAGEGKMSQKLTLKKEVEVLYDVDVLVVGCGVAGMIAAIGAARGAAARAVKEEVAPRNIDVLALRRTLSTAGFPMGDDPGRLKEFGGVANERQRTAERPVVRP